MVGSLPIAIYLQLYAARSRRAELTRLALDVLWGVPSIVYGASIEETARLGKARIQVSASEITRRSPVMVEVIGGVLHDRCLALYA